MNVFFQEWLINGKVRFFDPIKKRNLKARIKSEKKSKNETVSSKLFQIVSS